MAAILSRVICLGKVLKPWYDGYCFSEESLKSKNRVFNCNMVLYYLRNYMSYGCAPERMIDPNTKTDYDKMNKLLRFDKLDGNRKGIIKSIAETEQVITSLEESFPARALTNPDTFTSLRSSSYPLILWAYRNIGKPYTMAWQIPLLLYLFLFV